MRILLAAALLAAAPAAAHEVKKGDITVVHPVIRASLGKAPNTAAYFTIRNSGRRPDRLIAASCACAARAELHTHQMSGGIARMTRVPSITVPAGGSVTLAPGGHHLMLFGLKRPVANGKDVPVTLTFERAGTITTGFHGRSTIEAAPAAHAH